MSPQVSDYSSTDPNSLHEHFNHQGEAGSAGPAQQRRLAEGIFTAIIENPEYDLEDVKTLFAQYKNQFPNFDPAVDAVLANIEERLERWGDAVQTLSSKGSGSDLSRLLAIAFLELIAMQRRDALDNRINARTTAKGELLAQSRELSVSADKTKSATSSQATTTIVLAALGGVLSIGSTAMSMKNAKAINDLSSTTPKNPGAKVGLEDANIGDIAKQSSSSNPISGAPSAPAKGDVGLDLDAPVTVKADTPESQVPSPAKSQDARDGVDVNPEAEVSASVKAETSESQAPSPAKPQDARNGVDVDPEADVSASVKAETSESQASSSAKSQDARDGVDVDPAAEADVSASVKAETSESQASSSAKSQDARDGVDVDPAAEADVPANVKAETSENQASSPAKSQDARDGVDVDPAAEADVSANGNANTPESQASSPAKSQDARDGVDVNPAAEADVPANVKAETSEGQAPSSAKSQDGVDVKPEPGEADAPGGGKTKPEAEGQKPVENADADGKKPLGEDETGPEEAGVDDLEKKALEEQAEALELLRAKNTTYQAFGAGAQTLTTLGGGIGGLVSMGDTQAAKLADSDAAKHAAEAEEDKGEGDVVREAYHNLAEDSKSTVAFMKELNRAEEEEMKAVTSRA